MVFNMLALFVFVILSTSAANVDGDDYNCAASLQRCMVQIPVFTKLAEKEYDDTAEKINELCPLARSYLECAGDHGRSCKRGKELELFIKRHALLMNLLNDGCDSHTPFGRAILENYRCIDHIELEADDPCLSTANAAVVAYDRAASNYISIVKRNVRMGLGEDSDPCLTHTKLMVCNVNRVKIDCGTSARDVFLTVFRRLEYPFLDGIPSCSPVRFEQFLEAVDVYERTNA